MGHPEIITENFKDLDMYEGIVKCKLLPPKGLFHSILPCKMNGKLLFPLCKSCAEAQEQMPCIHTDAKRSFVGIWVTDELKKAARLYQVIEIYEIWHLNEISRYDPETMTGGFFYRIRKYLPENKTGSKRMACLV